MTPGDFSSLDLAPFLACGDVVRMNHDGVDGIHYMIILNHNPESGMLIALGVITSQVEKRKEFARNTGAKPETIVEFVYERASAVDCNSIKEISKDALTDKIARGVAGIGEAIPRDVVDRIWNGVIAGSAPMRLKRIMQNLPVS